MPTKELSASTSNRLTAPPPAEQMWRFNNHTGTQCYNKNKDRRSDPLSVPIHHWICACADFAAFAAALFAFARAFISSAWA